MGQPLHLPSGRLVEARQDDRGGNPDRAVPGPHAPVHGSRGCYPGPHLQVVHQGDNRSLQRRIRGLTTLFYVPSVAQVSDSDETFIEMQSAVL